MLSFSTTANSQTVIDIKQGVPAPYTGVLVPVQKGIEIKNQLYELDIYKRMTSSYSRSLDVMADSYDLLDKKYRTLQNQNMELIQENMKKGTSGWTKVGYFALGVITTGLIGFAVSKTVNGR